MTLPSTITNGQLDKTYAITWTSNNPAIDAAIGKVTRPETGAAVVTLTATLTNGDSKSFTVIIYGTKAQNAGVMHVVEDLLQTTDMIPNTGETGNVGDQSVDVLPFVMLMSALTLAVLMFVSKKRKYR